MGNTRNSSYPDSRPVLLKILAPSASENEASLFDAAAFYIGGAIGFELIGGLFAESHGTRNFT